ncbi:MAG: winged helix-turn-helix domain-containing protein [Myxococcota bacterium]
MLHLTGCSVDLETRRVLRDGEVRGRLTTREAELLNFLAERPGEVVSRERLHTEVFGFSEQSLSRAADSSMRRLRAKIERDPTQPEHLVTVFGVGYQFVPSRTGEAAEPTSPGGPAPPGAGFPEPPDRFFGREAEIAEVRGLFREGARWVTLVGLAGAGKTRLAREIGANNDGESRFVDLTTAVTLADAAQAVSDALGRTKPATEPTDVLAVLRVMGRALVVLDNLEQIADDFRQAARLWLEQAPEVLFLATSRVPLAIPGEYQVAVGPLTPDAAVALLADQMRALGATPSGSLREVADAADRLPLALQLAAGRLTLFSPSDLLEQMRQSPAALSGGAPRHPERHDSVVVALDSAVELLPDDLLKGYAQCGAFRTPFDFGDAQAILALPAATTIEALHALRSRSLIQAVRQDDGEMRFRQLPLVASHARMVLDRLGLRADVRARHRRHFLALAESLAEDVAVGIVHTDRLAERLPDMWEALDGATNAETVRFAQALGGILRVRGPYDRWRALVDAAWADRDAVEPRERVVARMARATFIGMGPGAVALMEEVVERARHVGDAELMSASLAYLAQLLYYDEPSRAVDLATEALRSCARPTRVGSRRLALAAPLRTLGRLDEAAALAEQAIQDALAVGAQRTLAHANATLARIRQLAAAPLPVIERLFRDALAAYRELRADAGARATSSGLLWTLVDHGALDRARELLDEIEPLVDRLGNPEHRGYLLGERGAVALAAGESRAERLLEQAWATFEAAAYPTGQWEVDELLAWSAYTKGDPGRAEHHLVRGGEERRPSMDRRALGALVLVDQGRHDDALAWLADVATPDEPGSLVHIARAAAAQNDAELRERLAACRRPVSRETGSRLPPLARGFRLRLALQRLETRLAPPAPHREQDP